MNHYFLDNEPTTLAKLSQGGILTDDEIARIKAMLPGEAIIFIMDFELRRATKREEIKLMARREEDSRAVYGGA